MIFKVDKKIVDYLFWSKVIFAPIFLFGFIFSGDTILDTNFLASIFVDIMLISMAAYFVWIQYKAPTILLSQELEVMNSELKYKKGSTITTFPFAEIKSMKTEKRFYYKSIMLKNRIGEEIELGAFKDMDAIFDFLAQNLKLNNSGCIIKGGF